jgi:hypothetical protein
MRARGAPARLWWCLAIALGVGAVAGGAEASPAPATTTTSAREMLEVSQEDTLIYQSPSSEAPVVRRLYVGELVQGTERVVDPRGNVWIRVQLGSTTSGFVPASKTAHAGLLPETSWRPVKVVRDERPLGIGVRALGETLGSTLTLRYLPLTRLGITLGVGAVIDKGEMRGRTFTGGLVMHPLLGRVSPFVEVGLTSLAYADGPSTLHVLATYLTAGLEVMFEWGGFAAAGACFVRSVDVEIGYSWSDAHTGSTQPGPFGRLGGMINGGVFQTIQPSITLGYGF